MILLSRKFLFIFFILLPEIALAHSPIKGIGFFLNGVLHPLLVPAQVIAIVALGLLYGQHQEDKNKKSVLVFLMAIIAGLILTGLFITPDVSILLLIVATIIGLIVVIGLTLPQTMYIILAVTVGFIVGLDSAQTDLDTRSTIVSLFGSGVGIYFLFLYSMALSESLTHRQWQKIAVRIMASWLCASALMVLALRFSHL